MDDNLSRSFNNVVDNVLGTRIACQAASEKQDI